MNNFEPPCVCGHLKIQHIYGESACRPGSVCETNCKEFTPKWSSTKNDEYNFNTCHPIKKWPSNEEILNGKLEFSKKIIRSEVFSGPGILLYSFFDDKIAIIKTTQTKEVLVNSNHNWVEICSSGQYYLEGTCQKDIELIPYTSKDEIDKRMKSGDFSYKVVNFKKASCDSKGIINDSKSLDDWKKIFPEQCNHEWKLYQGVMYSYNYCTKCDLKKELT